MKKDLLLSFMSWYNEDEEKTPISVDEIELYLKEIHNLS